MIDLSNKLIFTYTVVFIFIIFIFSLKTIKLNILFGTLVAAVVVYYIHNSKKNETQQIEKNKTQKKAHITNADENILKKDDMVNFLFSTQEFYYYNPNAHNDMMYNIRCFFQLYEETIKNNDKAGQNFQKMDDYKRFSLNSLHSIIFKLDSDKRVIDKLNNAIIKLEEILIKYQNEVHYIHLNNIHENGFNTKTKLITFGPNPVNSYTIDNSKNCMNIDDKFSYNIF